MFSKFLSILSLLQKGNETFNATAWKNGQITINVLSAFITLLVNTLNVFNVSVPIDVNAANIIAAGILPALNAVLTITTSKKVGFDNDSNVIQPTFRDVNGG